MMELRRKALASLPLSEAKVASFYDGSRSGTAEQCLQALCISHERLRAERDGLSALCESDAQQKLVRALALTDTGSREFLEAFPPRSAGERTSPQDVVAGWRVVEKIREVLLGG